MPAVIRVSLKTSPSGVPVPPVTEGVSRNDLRKGYEVTCESVHAATTYSWQLSFSPETSGPDAAEPDTNAYDREDSTASLSSTVDPQTKFVVDNEGAYLIRLVVDAGLPTEDVQFVRMRVMTTFAELFLISAGERRDESGTIPADVSAQGWANEQNSNIQRLMLLVRRASVSGRVLYVDHNRGRRYDDPSIEPNDPTNIVRMPGPESARLDETGMRIACEGFADFYSINSAIAYASACASRGEKPLDPLNPYIVKIAPGIYQEDLQLVPHVHLISDVPGEILPSEPEPGQMVGATIFNTTNPGAHHTYTGAVAGDLVVVRGMEFLNFTANTQPIMHQVGGMMLLDHCHMLQTGDDPNQGGAILMEANGALFSQLILRDSFVFMQVDDPTKYAITQADIGVIYGIRSFIWGDSAVRFNTNFQDDPDGSEVRFDECSLRSMTEDGYVFRGMPGIFISQDSEIDGEEASVNPNLAFELADTSGALAPAASVSYDVQTFISNTEIEKDIRVRTDQTSGTVAFHPSSIRFGGSYLFPTGAPDEWTPQTRGESLLYDNAYTDPLDPVGPLPTTLPTNKVQNAIDMLVGGTFPDGPGVPYYSLDSAYDGCASLQPFTRGPGLGREITADEGAVKIGGALYPLISWLTDRTLTGGLQTEGWVDIGPMVDNNPPIGALDDLGSEINMRPGVFAGGPMISLGRTVTPDGFSGGHRGLPAGIIMGGNPNAANGTNGHLPYNLYLRTRNNYDSDSDELGSVILNGGESYPDFGSIGAPGTKGGSVYIQGGTCWQPSGAPPYPEEGGFIFLAPGMASDAAVNSTPSKIRVCLLDNTVPFANLVAGQTFVPGGEGTFFVSGPNGTERFEVAAADNLAAVINTINQTSYQFVASDNAGKLQISSITPGPNSDVTFSGCIPASLNTNHLRDLDVGSGAVFSPGLYNKYIDIWCSDNGELTIDGDLVVTGSITGSSPALDYQIIDFIIPGPHQVSPTARLVGVRNPGAQPPGPTRLLVLPTLLPPGRELTIKDESFSMGVNNLPVIGFGGETIDGAPIFTMNVNSMSLRVYADGANWLIA